MPDADNRRKIATDTAVNRAQRDYWDSEGPRQYKEFGEVNDALLAPFGQAMLDAARLHTGERVLDVGCGHGASTFEAAERVAPSGWLVGIDISAAMLEPARRRVGTTGVDNVELCTPMPKCTSSRPGPSTSSSAGSG